LVVIVAVPTTKAPCEFAVIVCPLITIDDGAAVVTPAGGAGVGIAGTVEGTELTVSGSGL
jgi:hypothetical protein